VGIDRVEGLTVGQDHPEGDAGGAGAVLACDLVVEDDVAVAVEGVAVTADVGEAGARAVVVVRGRLQLRRGDVRDGGGGGGAAADGREHLVAVRAGRRGRLAGDRVRVGRLRAGGLAA